jgi:cell division protein FtsW (lipid II flippase)
LTRDQATSSDPTAALAAQRRWSELTLGLFAFVVIGAAYALVALADRPDLPPILIPLSGFVLGLFVVCHVAVRLLAPRADPTLLPVAVLLCGLGYVIIARLDRDAVRVRDQHLATAQARWMVIGVAAFVGTLWLVRRTRDLERYRYTMMAAGVGLLLLPLVPGIGRTINGARLWVRLGPLNFQPAELAKILLVIFMAAFLAERRELIATSTRVLGPFRIPDIKHFGPLLVAWGVSLVIMVAQKDLGSSLLFFAVFAVLIYVATGRAIYLVLALLLFAGGSVAAYQVFGHVQERVTTWLNPWDDALGDGYQLVEASFSYGWGGLAGTGLGMGTPTRVPNVATDFIFTAVAEELGLLGSTAVLCAFLLLVGSGLRIAARAVHPFHTLLATGLTAILGIQTVIILGGVTRVIPLTGIALPFFSYGGSSLLGSFVILALLLRISDETEERIAAGRQHPDVGARASEDRSAP